MKIISWNVAGIRAVLKKKALDFVLESDIDVICFQETKAEKEQVKNIDNFTSKFPHQLWNHSKTRKGYSGTAIWSKIPFKSIESPNFDQEGRITVVEFNDYFLVTVYTPNSKADLSRLVERVQVWDMLFREYCNQLKETKPVVICGDLNVIHQDIDIHQPEKHPGNVYAGFTNEERASFTQLLSCGYVDAFRLFNNEPCNYTWWSYMHNARKKNIGWRLDYFLVSTKLKCKIINSEIMNDIYGSDHCPISLELK